MVTARERKPYIELVYCGHGQSPPRMFCSTSCWCTDHVVSRRAFVQQVMTCALALPAYDYVFQAACMSFNRCPKQQPPTLSAGGQDSAGAAVPAVHVPADPRPGTLAAGQRHHHGAKGRSEGDGPPTGRALNSFGITCWPSCWPSTATRITLQIFTAVCVCIHRVVETCVAAHLVILSQGAMRMHCSFQESLLKQSHFIFCS